MISTIIFILALCAAAVFAFLSTRYTREEYLVNNKWQTMFYRPEGVKVRRRRDREETAFTVALSLLATAIVAGVLLASISGLAGWIDKSTYSTYSTIVNVSDTSRTEGRFFLGSGSINEEPVYYYYASTGAGYKRYWVPASNSTIVEDGKATIEFIKNTPANTTWFWNMDDGKAIEHVIHVPKGTVVQEFELDNIN